MVIDIDELRRLCSEYDKEAGEYPENHFEGFAFFEWVRLKVSGRPIKAYAILGRKVPEDWLT